MNESKLQRAEEALESTGGRAWSRIVNMLFGGVAVALLSIITVQGHRANELAEAQQAENASQNVRIAVIQNRMDQADVKTAETVRTLTALTAQVQAMTVQMTKNQDAIEHNNRSRL